MTGHRVASVDYAIARAEGKPSDDAPLVCSCGWQGQSGDFAAHRLEAGEKRDNRGFRPTQRVPWSLKP